FAPELREWLMEFEGASGVVSKDRRVPILTPGRALQVLALTLLKLDEERFVVVIEDATRLVAKERQLLELSTQDVLTGLWSRRRFFEVGEREVDRWRRYKTPLSLVTLDVDRFRGINETFGHG